MKEWDEMLRSDSVVGRKPVGFLFIAIAGGVIGVVISLLFARPAWAFYLPLLLLVLFISLYLLRLWQRNGGWDIADMRLWFAGFFLFYGVTEPLTKAARYFLPSNKVFFEATWLYCLGAFGLLASVVFSPSHHSNMHRSNPQPRLLFLLEKIAVLGIGMGFVLLLLDFQRVGGILSAFMAPKGEIMDQMSEARGNLPYLSVLLASLNLYLFSLIHWPRRNSRLAWGLFAAATVAFLAFCVAYGHRLHFFFVLLSLLGTLSSKLSVRISTRKLLLLLMVFGILFFSLDYLRAYNIIRYGLGNSASSAKSRFTSLQELVPTELVNPYGTLVISLWKDVERAYGTTYVQAIPNILPRSLYPGEKPLIIEKAWKSTYIPRLYPPGLSRYPGLGFLPVAEAYLNFGWMGPPIILFLIGLMLNYAQNLRCTALGSLLYAVWLPCAYYANRACFAGAIHQMFFVGMFVVVFYLTALLVSEVGQQVSKRSTPG